MSRVAASTAVRAIPLIATPIAAGRTNEESAASPFRVLTEGLARGRSYSAWVGLTMASTVISRILTSSQSDQFSM